MIPCAMNVGSVISSFSFYPRSLLLLREAKGGDECRRSDMKKLCNMKKRLDEEYGFKAFR